MLKCNLGRFIPFRGCASTKATRLHSLILTGSRRPQDFPTFDPISCVDGAQSLKPSFNLPSSLQNDFTLTSDHLGKAAEYAENAVFEAAFYTLIII